MFRFPAGENGDLFGVVATGPGENAQPVGVIPIDDHLYLPIELYKPNKKFAVANRQGNHCWSYIFIAMSRVLVTLVKLRPYIS